MGTSRLPEILKEEGPVFVTLKVEPGEGYPENFPRLYNSRVPRKVSPGAGEELIRGHFRADVVQCVLLGRSLEVKRSGRGRFLDGKRAPIAAARFRSIPAAVSVSMNSDATAQLLALICSVFYASALVSARAGMRYFDSHHGDSGFDPHAEPAAVVGDFRDRRRARGAACRRIAFHPGGHFSVGRSFAGLHRCRKNRRIAQRALQSVSPLVSAAIAVTILGEPTTLLIILGTVLVVAGIVLISWKSEWQLARLSALAPIAADRRRFPHRHQPSDTALRADDGQRAAVFLGADGYRVARRLSDLSRGVRRDRSGWCGIAAAIGPFLATGVCETISILLIITAISMGRVVIVAPIAASYPVWSLILSAIFLRDVESINWKGDCRNLERRRR